MTSIKSLFSSIEKPFFSLEVTPKENFTDVDLHDLCPLFVSTTWISDFNLRYESISNSPAMLMAKNLNAKNVPVLTHVSCFKLTEAHLDEILENSINIFPLKGDFSAEKQNYESPLELIREIRAKKGENVTIFTSAYPKSTEETEKSDMNFLKSKIQAGADAIITQVVYDFQVFTKFVQICRKNDIQVPIICGIFIPNSFVGLQRMQELTRQEVPEDLMNEYRKFEHDEKGFKRLSIQKTVELVEKIFENTKNEGKIGVHFFTMNNFELVRDVISQLKI
ncbi:uncharacterized protein LOC134827559 [Culicoides brevitarsis]|uniref:uncharacterized protein LOC134827559 n=1 Tax=Culicoides brevitarsis TaxID=469753 RepID=UPI00307C782F